MAPCGSELGSVDLAFTDAAFVLAASLTIIPIGCSGFPPKTIENEVVFDLLGAVFDRLGAVFDRLGAVSDRKRRRLD